MGDAVVAVLVKEVVRILGSLANQELALLRGLKGDILSLQNDFEQIQAVLQDAEEKQVKNNTVKIWLKHLRSVSLEAENVLDEISTEALLQSLHKKRGFKHRVRAFFSPDHNKFMSRVRIAHKVKDIRKKLDDIAFKRFELGLIPSDAISDVDDMVVENEMPNRETSSLIHDSSIIFGRDEELEMVTKAICNQDVGNGEVPVYSIWGMGGLGKTTLAQLVYNHERVKQCFELKCWIYVSEKFQVKEIMKKIIESIDDCGCTLTLLDKLQESLQSRLGGKKFLVVLDDVWVEDDENEKSMWEELRKTLRCGADGSIVVMTTRSQATSQMFSKVPKLQHKLGCLSRDDSWSLFEKLAFAPGRERDNISELEHIGREIVEKCKGLPLAVKTLGSLMWSKSSTSDWQHVKDNNLWDLDEVKVVPAILKLSYDKLLPHLKRCFAYCCLFPKGCEIEKDVLISLWVVNGFIPPKGGKDLYMLGEEILNCFVWRSFLQVVNPGKFSDGIYRYKMHDLMHDMAHDVMGHDCLVMEHGSNKAEIPEAVVHLSSSRHIKFSDEDLRKLTSLRSIFMFRKEAECSKSFKQAYVRVLHLDGIYLMTFPKSVCKLKHLKYLNLSNSSIEVLPKSIMYLQNLQYLNLSRSSIKVLPKSIMYLQNLQYLNLSHSYTEVLPEGIINLQNLQTLRLYNCYSLRKLPKGLRYMRNLHCLDTCGILLKDFPEGIKELTSLRILSRFPVGKGDVAKIGELEDLNLLEGKLWLEGLENVGSLEEAKSAKLECKRNLLDLLLRWSKYRELELAAQRVVDEEVLEGLEPNPSLKKLTIYGYMGMIISPSWLLNLKNLLEIKISMCSRCEHIPLLGRLPNLRIIDLSYMGSFKCFLDDDTNMLGGTTDTFLCVEELHINYCRSLVSLPSNLPKLKVLYLEECNALVSLPDEIQSFKHLKELTISDCEQLRKRYGKQTGVEWHKISHIPHVKFLDPL
ncbi:putative virus X resistance protein-like, coiled-coil [Helianthus annuus]|uniref:Virus X resistance protein-like, coiled-coil n=1 Tax=Helianthus annuus TaxID=4232 RepID=A0A9K3JY69_HELAN|nr:putative disease resistance protein RGA3 [Helianthus annuus]KAF5823946.1 putative virus X resistance protein-like, coiled-coil [Helianthus annuus]KAJ0624939.1 putative virus X resistance protein-like, coiled-coil [Helianthus annuus]KAJ0950011.1 putative virus X resistance protein-like, coiled-coil [Helianthus annuus]KAJ0958841.1 putative virus X resistance protein-like, coiled-coil [Helianthus annuus]